MRRRWYEHPIMTLVRLASVALIIGNLFANISRLSVSVSLKGLRQVIRTTLRTGFKDEIAAEDQRYESLRQAFRNLGVRGTIGYVTEAKPEELSKDTEWFRKYYLSQYALAPLIVSAAPGQFTYVIGNFENRDINLKSYADLEPVFISGNGLVLFHRRTP